MDKKSYENKMSHGGENKGHPDAIIEDVVKNMATPLLIQEINKDWWDRVDENKERT